jgi:class 3 adenylate cyclase
MLPVNLPTLTLRCKDGVVNAGVIDRHGGSVEKFIGDAVMALCQSRGRVDRDGLREAEAALRKAADAVARKGALVLERRAKERLAALGGRTRFPA